MKHMQIQRARVGRRGSFVDIFLFVWIAKDLRGWQKDQCMNTMSFKRILFLIKKITFMASIKVINACFNIYYVLLRLQSTREKKGSKS